MIAYGPGAIAAVLDYLEAPADGRTRPLLSPKSREGLEWVRAERGVLPLRLRNALEHLLINLKTSGIDLDDLFAKPSISSELPAQTRQTAPEPEGASLPDAGKFRSLSDGAEDRLDLLLEHVDALEEIGRQQDTFEQRKTAAIAIRKLRERDPDLRPMEIGELQRLYGLLCQDGKDGRS
ncbi:hypothetical protein [Rhodovulum sp. ES.010]|uniref:hypothetical protein n=1 Tax=Rhodovulum sp. ES.010 TaxID=1882821 RepID=UPI000941209F|nr:hypothetical protein [Rhodovulum sp. ES.010]